MGSTGEGLTAQFKILGKNISHSEAQINTDEDDSFCVLHLCASVAKLLLKSF
jgi:hypothetical protein